MELMECAGDSSEEGFKFLTGKMLKTYNCYMVRECLNLQLQVYFFMNRCNYWNFCNLNVYQEKIIIGNVDFFWLWLVNT